MLTSRSRMQAFEACFWGNELFTVLCNYICKIYLKENYNSFKRDFEIFLQKSLKYNDFVFWRWRRVYKKVVKS